MLSTLETVGLYILTLKTVKHSLDVSEESEGPIGMFLAKRRHEYTSLGLLMRS